MARGQIAQELLMGTCAKRNQNTVCLLGNFGLDPWSGSDGIAPLKMIAVWEMLSIVTFVCAGFAWKSFENRDRDKEQRCRNGVSFLIDGSFHQWKLFVSNMTRQSDEFIVFLFSFRWMQTASSSPSGGKQHNTTAEELRFRGDQATPPESICSHPCNASQAKKYVEGEGCCWTCVECVLYQVL